ncbi:MAG: purine-nucleoside phosphorylase [Pedosphaera sp.]|nr:purine-nucleoside phosphorylase [Pedosphaera sp.]
MIIPPSRAAARLRKLIPFKPKFAIVLGSGFQNVSSDLKTETEIDYRQIPGFVTTGVAGHPGRLQAGYFGSVPVLLLCGRAHYYEGHSFETITFPVRVLAEYGIEQLLLTNAAGGINRRLRPGDFMAISDHINLMGDNPLRGVIAPGANNFVDLSAVYDSKLRQALVLAGKQAGVAVRTGVYVAVSGPTYETPAEIRAFARLGADAVGMSTVPEAIVARQCGLRVAALSCITNLAAGRNPHPLSHQDVIKTGKRAGVGVSRIIDSFLRITAETLL